MSASQYPLLPDVGADEFEQTLLAQWSREDLFAASQAARADGTPYVFYEGPPTANGRPGIHHVFARTVKDLFCRHRVMTGHHVARSFTAEGVLTGVLFLEDIIEELVGEVEDATSA